MSRANVNDRSSLERLYPRDVWAQDAGKNAVSKAEVLYGVRIVSPVDANGDFDLVRASHQVAESNSEGDVIFLFPQMGDDYAALMQKETDYGGAEEKGDALEKLGHKDQEYNAFIDRIIEAARSAKFKPAIGRGEERLRGFHGG
ncbi:MAG: hypothetical protein M3145_10730 [Pseudomonadota bacterium]|nr:hypothetical protein [Pseudomonadota bacterium]